MLLVACRLLRGFPLGGMEEVRRLDRLPNKRMKIWIPPSVGFAILFSTTAAWAQANGRTVNEGAGVIAWLLVGLIGGYLASRIVNKSGEGLLRDIILGIIGGIVGGAIFRAFGEHGVTGLNL